MPVEPSAKEALISVAELKSSNAGVPPPGQAPSAARFCLVLTQNTIPPSADADLHRRLTGKVPLVPKGGLCPFNSRSRAARAWVKYQPWTLRRRWAQSVAGVLMQILA